ncbi:MAG TPA: hypothetical protein VGG51_12920 [Candidatus Cybelea sp.]
MRRYARKRTTISTSVPTASNASSAAGRADGLVAPLEHRALWASKHPLVAIGRFRPRRLALQVLGWCVGVALAAGCGSTGASLPPAPSLSGQAAIVNSVQPSINARCKPFLPTFDELVACQRANGSLGSFPNPKVTWRVRYFVRYSEMPCNEAPTVEEAYVFHMVMTDLSDDADLNDAERSAIRSAMFDGRTRCK